LLFDMLVDAEAAAGRTGAIGMVEREQPRLDFRNRETGHRAGEFFRKQNPFRPALVVDFCDFLRRRLGLLPPPLWGRVGEGGNPRHRRAWLTPLPALRPDLPPNGGGNKRRGGRGAG